MIEDDGLVEKVKSETGPYLASRLQELAEFPFVGEVKSMGIIGAIEIDITKIKPGTLMDSIALGAKIGEIAWGKGVNARPIGSTFGMKFPMIIAREQIDNAVDILKESFREALT